MELSVHQDKIVSSLNRWKSGEKQRASDAGEMREEIGELIEFTGLSKKALAFVRMLDKQEPDKRADILRSLTPLLDMMEPVWDGQKTADMFNDDAVEPADAPDDAPDLAAEADDFEKHLNEAAE